MWLLLHSGRSRIESEVTVLGPWTMPGPLGGEECIAASRVGSSFIENVLQDAVARAKHRWTRSGSGGSSDGIFIGSDDGVHHRQQRKFTTFVANPLSDCSGRGWHRGRTRLTCDDHLSKLIKDSKTRFPANRNDKRRSSKKKQKDQRMYLTCKSKCVKKENRIPSRSLAFRQQPDEAPPVESAGNDEKGTTSVAPNNAISEPNCGRTLAKKMRQFDYHQTFFNENNNSSWHCSVSGICKRVLAYSCRTMHLACRNNAWCLSA